MVRVSGEVIMMRWRVDVDGNEMEGWMVAISLTRG